MRIQKVQALYFSATGNTDRAVNVLAEALAQQLDVPWESSSFTRPEERASERMFSPEELVVVGAPTYAGKLPNKILPDFQTKLHGDGALAVAVVLYGNRSFDHALAELCATLEADGFHTVAAGAFVGRHAFTDVLADGRPDWNDKGELRRFAAAIVKKLADRDGTPSPVSVPGDAAAPYYVPKGTDGEPAKFLKAKPRTDLLKCSGCGTCARACPMGAIDAADVSNVPGICIKCHSCVRRCTRKAKYFDDPAFLSHVAMLEQNYAEPKKNEMFL